MMSEKHRKNGYESGRIVLSCPHAQCDLPDDIYEEHWCDWVAEDALNGVLKHLGDPDARHIIGRDKRQKHDLNRHRSRKQPFRELLRRSINRGDTHLDIHSYPHTDESDDWFEYDLVLFEHGDGRLAKTLQKHLDKAGYSVKMIPGDTMNDICTEATDAGAYSCLVEFSSLLKEEDRMDGACKAVADAANDFHRTRRNPRVRKKPTTRKVNWWNLYDWKRNAINSVFEGKLNVDRKTLPDNQELLPGNVMIDKRDDYGKGAFFTADLDYPIAEDKDNFFEAFAHFDKNFNFTRFDGNVYGEPEEKRQEFAFLIADMMNDITERDLDTIDDSIVANPRVRKKPTSKAEQDIFAMSSLLTPSEYAPEQTEEIGLNDFETYLRTGERDFAQAWMRLGVAQGERDAFERYRMPNLLKIEAPDFTAFFPIMTVKNTGEIEFGGRTVQDLSMAIGKERLIHQELITIWTDDIEKTKLWLAKQMFETAFDPFEQKMTKTEWESSEYNFAQLPVSADYDIVGFWNYGRTIAPMLSAVVANALRVRGMTKRNPKVKKKAKTDKEWWDNLEWKRYTRMIYQDKRESYMAYLYDCDDENPNWCGRARITKLPDKHNPPSDMYELELFGAKGPFALSRYATYGKTGAKPDSLNQADDTFMFKKDPDILLRRMYQQGKLRQWYADIGGDKAFFDIDLPSMFDEVSRKAIRANPIHAGEMLNDDAELAPLGEVLNANMAEVEIESSDWFPNYGHYLDYINIADDMAWDIFAPGFDESLPTGIYRVREVYGVLKLKNGNHKICVLLDHPNLDRNLVVPQIMEFKDWYETNNDMLMMFEPWTN